MEPQQQQQQLGSGDQEGGSGKSSSYLCRQSSTRWTPTTDQIRILKDLYYNNGVRSPNAEQIQRISARLRQYGKIEGKNVFYWFQNHKARERQKKRFTTTTTATTPPPAADMSMQMQRAAAVSSGIHKTEDSAQPKYPCFTTTHGFSCPSSSSSYSTPGVVSVGQMMGGGTGYGAIAVENNFRECSISAGANGHNLQWPGVAQHSQSSYYFFDTARKSSLIDESFGEDHQEAVPEIETLPLFPMHGEDSPGFCGSLRSGSDAHYGVCHWANGSSNGGSRTSLELSLNSFAGNFPNF
ncbi:hypothetical protein Ancab_026582 [Ancistrocladus abbreviatus]